MNVSHILGQNLVYMWKITAGYIHECIGVSIVTCISLESQSLYAISPILSFDLSKHKYLNLVKGSMIPPNMLLYSKLDPCHLYVTGEAFGERNSIMKPRTNMKKKGHAQS